jgi:hypothetical protein
MLTKCLSLTVSEKASTPPKKIWRADVNQEKEDYRDSLQQQADDNSEHLDSVSEVHRQSCGKVCGPRAPAIQCCGTRTISTLCEGTAA